MSNTKVCPACQKSLPVLAVRCKFCGFKQPLESSDDGEDAAEGSLADDGQADQDTTGNNSRKTTLPPARMGAGKKKNTGKGKKGRSDKKGGKPAKNTPKAEAGTPGNKRSGGLAAGKKSASTTKSRKRTLMGPGVLDSATSKKDVLSGAGFGRKAGASTALKPLFKKEEKPLAGTEVRDSKPGDKRKPAQASEAPADSGASESTRPSKKPTRPAMTAIPEKKPASRDAEDSDGIEDSEILSLDDDSQLVVLEGEDQSGTVELDLDALSAEEGISEMSDDDIFDDKSDIRKKPTQSDNASPKKGETSVQLRKAVLTLTSRLASMRVGLARGLKNAALKMAPQLRRVPVKVWAIVAGVAVLLMGAGIFLARGCDEAPMPKTEKVAKADANEYSKTKATHTRSEVKNASRENQASPAAASGNCHPVSAFGAFLWHGELASLVEKSGYKAVCDLMGQSFASMVTALADDNPVMAGSIDGLPDTAALEIVPSDAAALSAGGIRLMFHQTKLFRVVLDFGKARDIGLDMDDIAEVLETKAEKNTSGELSVTAVNDGAVRIELVQERGAEKLRELQFTAIKLDDALANRLEAQRRARRFLIKANDYVRRRQFSNAADAFQSAVDANDASGSAWVGRALAQLYLEDFSGARAAADKALTVSDDDMVHSMAAQALAVVFLRSGDLKAAIAQLEKAVSHNGDNAEATLALRELKTGEYGTERVAITAARMSCPEELGASLQGLLAKGNFPDTQTFFNALRRAKMDIQFERLKRDWVSRECR